MEPDGAVPVLLRMKIAGRSQREFARHLGVSQGLVSRLLRGEYRLGIAAAGKIAAAYPEMSRVLAGAVGDRVIETAANGHTKDAA